MIPLAGLWHALRLGLPRATLAGAIIGFLAFELVITGAQDLNELTADGGRWNNVLREDSSDAKDDLRSNIESVTTDAPNNTSTKSSSIAKWEPSMNTIKHRMHSLLETQDVARAEEYKVVSECMRRENEQTLALVHQSLRVFRERQVSQKKRSVKFKQMAAQVVSTVENLVELAHVSGAFSGYADGTTEEELSLAAEAKSLHMDQEASQISEMVGHPAGRRLLQFNERNLSPGKQLIKNLRSGNSDCQYMDNCVYSPGYPSQYGANKFCQWSTSTDTRLPGYSDGAPFDTEANADKVEAYFPGKGMSVLSREGIIPDNPDVWKSFSGNTIPSIPFVPKFTVFSFTSDGTVSGNGFALCFKDIAPTESPTRAPTSPTNTPTMVPSHFPTPPPTLVPTGTPSFAVTDGPSHQPTTIHLGQEASNSCDYGKTITSKRGCERATIELLRQRGHKSHAGLSLKTVKSPNMPPGCSLRIRSGKPLVNEGFKACRLNEKGCSSCHGHCRDDSECARGLQCFQRGMSLTQVPGCQTGGPDDVKGVQYCFQPAARCWTLNPMQVLIKSQGTPWVPTATAATTVTPVEGYMHLATAWHWANLFGDDQDTCKCLRKRDVGQNQCQNLPSEAKILSRGGQLEIVLGYFINCRNPPVMREAVCVKRPISYGKPAFWGSGAGAFKQTCMTRANARVSDSSDKNYVHNHNLAGTKTDTAYTTNVQGSSGKCDLGKYCRANNGLPRFPDICTHDSDCSILDEGFCATDTTLTFDLARASTSSMGSTCISSAVFPRNRFQGVWCRESAFRWSSLQNPWSDTRRTCLMEPVQCNKQVRSGWADGICTQEEHSHWIEKWERIAPHDFSIFPRAGACHRKFHIMDTTARSLESCVGSCTGSCKFVSFCSQDQPGCQSKKNLCAKFSACGTSTASSSPGFPVDVHPKDIRNGKCWLRLPTGCFQEPSVIQENHFPGFPLSPGALYTGPNKWFNLGLLGEVQCNSAKVHYDKGCFRIDTEVAYMTRRPDTLDTDVDFVTVEQGGSVRSEKDWYIIGVKDWAHGALRMFLVELHSDLATVKIVASGVSYHQVSLAADISLKNLWYHRISRQPVPGYHTTNLCKNAEGVAFEGPADCVKCSMFYQAKSGDVFSPDDRCVYDAQLSSCTSYGEMMSAPFTSGRFFTSWSSTDCGRNVSDLYNHGGVGKAGVAQNILSSAEGKGPSACYEAVMESPECLKDYFSYASRSELGHCACKVSDETPVEINREESVYDFFTIVPDLSKDSGMDNRSMHYNAGTYSLQGVLLREVQAEFTHLKSEATPFEIQTDASGLSTISAQRGRSFSAKEHIEFSQLRTNYLGMNSDGSLATIFPSKQRWKITDHGGADNEYQTIMLAPEASEASSEISSLPSGYLQADYAGERPGTSSSTPMIKANLQNVQSETGKFSIECKNTWVPKTAVEAEGRFILGTHDNSQACLQKCNQTMWSTNEVHDLCQFNARTGECVLGTYTSTSVILNFELPSVHRGLLAGYTTATGTQKFQYLKDAAVAALGDVEAGGVTLTKINATNSSSPWHNRSWFTVRKGTTVNPSPNPGLRSDRSWLKSEFQPVVNSQQLAGCNMPAGCLINSTVYVQDTETINIGKHSSFNMPKPPIRDYLKQPIWNTERFAANDGHYTPLCENSHPSLAPTLRPTAFPSVVPTVTPSVVPTGTPSWSPSFAPTGTPSLSPSFAPTANPTLSPTPTNLEPEHAEKNVIRRQTMKEKSSKSTAKHLNKAERLLSTEVHDKQKLLKTRQSMLLAVDALQRKVATKLAYVDHLAVTCNATAPQSKEKSAKIKTALERVKLPQTVISKSKKKVEIIRLIKGSLTKLLSISRLNDAHGVFALEQQAHNLVQVSKEVQALSNSIHN